MELIALAEVCQKERKKERKKERTHWDCTLSLKDMEECDKTMAMATLGQDSNIAGKTTKELAERCYECLYRLMGNSQFGRFVVRLSLQATLHFVI